MAGLLADVLPYLYSQGDRAKRFMGGLLSDPLGSLEQTAGGLLDAHQAQQGLMARAFANPQRPFQLTDKLALGQAIDNTMAGPLGFAPAGVVNFTKWGKTAKPPAMGTTPLPDHPALMRVPNPAAAMVKDNLDMRIGSLPDGTFLSTYLPQWGSPGKSFYAVGDNLDELIAASTTRAANSSKAVTAAKQAKENKSLLGQLKQEFGDNFKEAHSGRSASEYYTHTPSGTKIRISDHDLPLGYEQPDLDFRKGVSPDEVISALKRYFGDE